MRFKKKMHICNLLISFFMKYILKQAVIFMEYFLLLDNS